jgi:hypothetical protein
MAVLVARGQPGPQRLTAAATTTIPAASPRVVGAQDAPVGEPADHLSSVIHHRDALVVAGGQDLDRLLE